jgi:toxin-antitoxin system PIN domain toxin
MNSCLVDINVWIALGYPGHRQHRIAMEWFANRSGAAYFCRHTQLGLLRLLTNVRVMGPDVKSQIEAWRYYDLLREDPSIGFLEEPSTTERILRDLTHSRVSSPNTWSDAYLGAFARAFDLSLVSFDTAFRTMVGVDAVILTPER